MADVNATIDVNRPLRTVYNQWTQFEDFPQFMDGVVEVKQLDNETIGWRAKVAGVERTWQSRIVEQDPDRAIAWISTEGTRNDGRVTFEALGPSTTRVHLALDLDPQDFVERAGQALGFVGRKAQTDLERFREFIEGRPMETGAWRGEISSGGAGEPDRSPVETPAAVDPEGSQIADPKQQT